MELLEKYLYAVGRKLPRKQKDDILKELRSIIMDNLDDVANGKEPSEEQLEKVIINMGSPAQVAKRYRTGPSWLIGPDYYDTYLLIVKIVLAATLGGYLIALIVSMLTQTGGFGQRMWKFALDLLAIVPRLFLSAGIVTLIFAIIERTAKKPVDLDFDEEENWTPAKLEPVPKKEETVKPVEAVLGIVFAVFALIVFNFFSSKVGLYYTPTWGEGWQMVEIFNQKALDLYIPLWSVVWSLSIGLHAWLLSIGKYNLGTKVFEFFITALDVGILFTMANGPAIFKSTELTGDLEPLKMIVNFFTNNQNLIFTILAILTLIGLVVNVVKFLVRQAKGSSN